jgi:hypothetical protein
MKEMSNAIFVRNKTLQEKVDEACDMPRKEWIRKTKSLRKLPQKKMKHNHEKFGGIFILLCLYNGSI